MGRAINLKIILVVLLIAFTINISCKKKESVQKEYSQKSKLEAGVSSPYYGKISYSPQGKLEIYTPEKISFALPSKYNIFPNSTISYNQSKKCLIIKPEIKGSIIWVDKNQFDYIFDDIIIPEKEYKIILKCIPLSDKEEPIKEEVSFSFITPPLKLISGYVKLLEKTEIQTIIRWNYPLSASEIGDYVLIYDADGNELKPKSVSIVKDDLNAVMLAFANKSPEYKIIFKKGLPIKNNKGFLQKDVEYIPSLPTGTLSLSGLSVKEGDENFIVSIDCRISGSKNCIFDMNKIKSYFRIEPYLPFKIISYGNTIELHANFTHEKTYSLYVSSGLMTIDGYQLGYDYKQSFYIPKPAPKLSFAIQGLYLGRKGGTKLPLRVSHIDNIEVEVYRMPNENLPYWYFDKNQSSWGFRRLSEKIVSKKIINVNSANESKLYWLDLSEILNTDDTGIFKITAKKFTKSSTNNENQEEEEESDYYYEDDYYSNDSTHTNITVIISDISIIAKLTPLAVYTWTLNSSTIQPESNVKVKLLSDKNVAMGQCTTNNEGFCKLIYTNSYDRIPYIVTASKGNNFSFIHFNSSTLQTNEFEISGGVISNNNYIGYSYFERDLYRPGETINFAFILRQYRTYKPLALPIIVKIYDPQGKEFATLKGATNESGIASFKLNTIISNATGKYHLDFLVGNNIVESNSFFLEEFVPQRIHASIITDKKIYYNTNEINGILQAEYLFGAPASNQSYDLTCKAAETNFSPKGYKDYSFGVYRKEPLVYEQPAIKGTLDENGRANFKCSIENIKEFKSPIKLNMIANVFEAGSGRASKNENSVLIHPSNFYIGLKSNSKIFQPGANISISGVIVDRNENLYTNITSLKYNIYKISYNYIRVYNSSYNNFNWEWSEIQIPITEQQSIEVTNGKFNLSFKPTDYWANYLIEFSDMNNTTTGSIMVNSWSYDYEENQISNPERLHISFNKEVADFNEEITASTLLPFKGNILWTIELDDVIIYKWDKASVESASFTFKVPNNTSTIYASALLITSSENYAVQRAFGISKLLIKPKKHYLNLEIETPDQIKPNNTLKVKLKAKEPFTATVAIVDEGILQITKYKTPNAYDGIFKDLTLRCSTSETLGWIMRKDAYSLPGGGEKIAPENIPEFTKIVSYWSGIIKSSNNGIAEINFKVPQYEGKLRVMVTALNENKIGSIDKYIKVVSNVSVLPTIPRFAYYDDEITIPISFRNNLSNKVSTSINVKLNGANLIKDYPKEFTIEPYKSYQVAIPIKVQFAINELIIEITSKSGAETYRDTFKIPAYPNKPLNTEMSFIQLKKGKNDLSNYFQLWYLPKLKVKLVASPIAGLNNLNHIEYLIQYPYGCIEQTSSSLLPLIKMQNILNLIDPEIADKAFLTNKIYSGIQRILSMQTIEGGFSYWPGGTNADVWSTIYATFVLLEAKKAGFIVPDNSINSAIEFIKAYAHKNTMAYLVLAMAGKLDAKYINDLLSLNKNTLSAEDLMFLAGAFHYIGKENTAKELLNKALTIPLPNERRLSYDFYSQQRAEALKLYFSELIYPGATNNESLTFPMIQKLTRNSYFYSTQELAWSILALGTRIQNSNYAKNYSAKFFINDNLIKPIQTTNSTIWEIKHFDKSIENAYINLESDGIIYLYLEIRGFKKDDEFKRYANGIELTKQFLDFNGKSISNFHQKDMVIIKLTIKSLLNHQLDNVAISDYLPAGFEIENPRLNPDMMPNWINKNSLLAPDYVDYRDERIDIFANLGPKEYNFYYIIRATTIGSFFMPPAEAVVMYQPEYKAKTDEAIIKVLPSR